MRNKEEHIKKLEARSTRYEESDQCSVFSAQCTQAVISTTAEERTVDSEHNRNRFLTSLEMTKDVPLKARRSKSKDPILLTIKYNNSPSRRVRSIRKTFHLSSLKLAGGSEEIKIPFFPILPASPLGEMLAGRQTKGNDGAGTLANNLKQSMPMRHD